MALRATRNAAHLWAAFVADAVRCARDVLRCFV